MPEIIFGIVLAGAVLVVIGGLLLIRRRSNPDNMFTGLDSSIPNAPTMAASDSKAFGPSAMSATDFRLIIQDIFMIKGRGLVVTGQIDSGSLQVGQRIQISSPNGSEHYDTQVKGLEAFHRQLDVAQTGDNVGILLGGLTKDQIKPGMIIT